MTERSDRDGEEQFVRAALESVDGEHLPSSEALARMESAMIEAYHAERTGFGATGGEYADDDRRGAGVGLEGGRQRRWGRLSLVAACVAVAVGSVFAFRALASESNDPTTPAVPAPATVDAWCRQELAGLVATVPTAIAEDGFSEDVQITLDEFSLVLRRTSVLPDITAEQSGELQTEFSDRMASVKAELILDSESPASRQAVAEMMVDFGDALVELGGSAEACAIVDR